MSPNEYAIQMKDTAVRILDESLYQFFTQKTHQVPVTRNGVRINNVYYGRFDSELQAYQEVKIAVSSDFPDICYCEELGRCLERYQKETICGDEQLTRKKHIEKTHKNQLDAAMQKAIDDGLNFMREVVQTTDNPYPDRAMQIIAPQMLVERGRRIDGAVQAHRKKEAEHKRKFTTDRQTQPGTGRGGLLNRSKDIKEQLAILPD